MAPVGLLEGAALVTSLVVQQEPRVNSCHFQYTGGVHLKRRMRRQVRAVGSTAPNFVCPAEDWAIVNRVGVCISHNVLVLA